MGRRAKFYEVGILDAAATIIAERGPHAATMTAVGTAIGASNGSIYHRFGSRDELLGRVWLRTAVAFQGRFASALAGGDARQAALAAALTTPQWVRGEPGGARILLAHRREDFLSGGWPPELRAEAERLGQRLEASLMEITRRLTGGDEPQSLIATTLALVDIPYAAVRRFVIRRDTPPQEIDDLIIAACAAVLDMIAAVPLEVSQAPPRPAVAT
ncbi:MAG: TetR/AcrR family transcriptional regulator [Caulobacteraceae bacterium]